MNVSLGRAVRQFVLASALLGLFLNTGCNIKPFVMPRTIDGIYEAGVEEFKNGNYAQAQKLFDIIKLQYPTSKYADDAQYYLAEINVAKNEHILAAYNYNQLRRTFPNSEYAKISAYKAAYSNYKMSPKSDRDQDYTRQAIKAFGEFQASYPKDSLAVEAGKRIVELRGKLAKHDFETAELYVKMQAPRSALVYYDLVINTHSDSEFLEPAFAGKIRMLARLKRTTEAKEALRLYRQRFPQGNFREEMETLSQTLPA